MIRRLSLLALSALLILAAACGSSSSADESAPAQPAVVATAQPAAAQQATAAPSPVVALPRLPVTVTDKDGKSVTITNIDRIIPLNGDIAEVIFALGLGDKVVATDTSATFPEAATKLPKVGYQRALAAEGILTLRPTLVIGNENAGPPAVLDQLRGAGVTVLLLKYPSTLEAAVGKTRAVAQALGVPESGERVAAQTQKEIDAALALAATAKSKPRVMLLNLRGNASQTIGGKGTAGDSLIAAAGGIDSGVAAGIEGYKPITAEALAIARPDVLLLLTAGLESVGGIDGLLAIPGIAQTPAGRDKRILSYEDQYLLGMGPRVGLALMELVKGLHPELR